MDFFERNWRAETFAEIPQNPLDNIRNKEKLGKRSIGKIGTNKLCYPSMQCVLSEAGGEQGGEAPWFDELFRHRSTMRRAYTKRMWASILCRTGNSLSSYETNRYT